MPVPAPSWEKKWKWPHKYFEFKSLCNKNRLIFSCVNVYVIPSPCTLPPLSPSTSIIHCPFLYVLLILNSAPLQPGTDVFEFTLAFMCTSFHTVLCRVGDQKAIAHVRTGSSQLSTKEQSVVNVWLWLDGGTSRQCLFFFFFLPFFSWPCNTMGLCFVSCHSQKNTDVKQNILWPMAGSEEAEVEKSCRVHLALTTALPSLTRSALFSLPLLPELPLWVQLPQNRAEHGAAWAKAACRALLPGLGQGMMRFSFGCCELRLGLL